jgi:hypothetical protein
MSLLADAMEKCIIMDKSTSKDDRGGFKPTYVEGADFDAAITLDTSVQARIGAKQGVTNLYTVITSKNVNLQYHDVFKRVSDNKIFRVTSDGDDKKTPNSASLDMRLVTAEQYTIGG